ncbi:MAG TPA: hypothetical protein VNL18_08225 [Gemmatimonadales bacterium]|nr:hypothetical protein [Gemmatimonadales bacterium]
MSERPPRQVKFVKARTAALAPARYQAEVELRGAANTYVGRAEAADADLAALQAAARATADALRLLGHRVDVKEIEVLKPFGRFAVAALVEARYEDEKRSLVGFCMDAGDLNRAASLAVLNAVNRFLDIG